MLIGELSKRSGFSRDTIRYYQKIGLILPPQNSRTEHNYIDYPEEVLQKLFVIKKYKEVGFTLEQIRELLVLQSIKVLNIEKLIQLIELKITGIDDEIEKLHAIKLKLNRELQGLTKHKVTRIVELPDMKAAA